MQEAFLLCLCCGFRGNENMQFERAVGVGGVVCRTFFGSKPLHIFRDAGGDDREHRIPRLFAQWRVL